jgi:Protein of unknown function (DUF1553)/Protein of unknown function (DUF1549)
MGFSRPTSAEETAMIRCRASFMLALGFLGLTASSALAADEPRPALLDAEALASRIDELIGDRLAQERIQQAPRCDDATFLRRVCLDLAGCIPPLGDVRNFSDDPRPDKRRLWVEDLLAGRKPTDRSDAYARHFATLWRSWLLSRQPIEAQVQSRDLQGWLQRRLAANAGYDRLVRELYSQPGFTGAYPSPEALAGGTARLFLGVKLECSQCHEDRSGGKWEQDEFWSFAAFFAPGQLPASAEDVGPTIKVGSRGRTVPARFLGGGKPRWRPNVSPAVTLGDWITSADNPYFARAAVNRTWAYLLGTGFIEPLDGWNEKNPPSHPELLDLLAQQFAAHRFDLKYLLRAITASQTYQASSAVLAEGKDTDARLFARAAVRGLSAEQLFDSLAEATEYHDPLTGELTAGGQAVRTDFVVRFTVPAERPVDAITSVPEALYLMNSSFARGRTSLTENRALATIADAARMSTARRIEELYLLVLARRPRAEEKERLVKYVNRGGATDDPRQALADVFWALLNSAEFRTNH